MSVVVARDPSTVGKLIFPWPNPVPWGAEIVCTESEVAVLCPNWEVGETLGPGRHTVKPGNPQQTHVLAYFINTAEQVVAFERMVSLIDRSTGQPAPVRFFGNVRIKVGDPELMCHQLVGLPYHDLATGVLRSVDVSVSKSFERMMAKLCMAMATVSDMATPGAVAQLVSLVTGTHPLATAVTGLEFLRFEQFGLSVGTGEPVVWHQTPPNASAGARAESPEPELDAPTSLDNIALLDPDELNDDDDDDEDALTSQETIPVDVNAVREAAQAASQSGAHPPAHPAAHGGDHSSGSGPSVIVSEELSAPPPPKSAHSTGSSPAIATPGTNPGQSPFAPPPGRNPTTPPGGAPGGPPPPAPMAGPPPPAAPRTSTMPPGARVQPTAPGARVQPTMPGMVPGQGHASGRIQPTGPGVHSSPRASSPFIPNPSPAPAGGGQRRKTPPLGMPAQPTSPSGHSPLPIGSQVLVYWNDGLWHTATIRQFSQGQYQVSLDGSHAVTWVKPNQIRRQ